MLHRDGSFVNEELRLTVIKAYLKKINFVKLIFQKALAIFSSKRHHHLPYRRVPKLTSENSVLKSLLKFTT